MAGYLNFMHGVLDNAEADASTYEIAVRRGRFTVNGITFIHITRLTQMLGLRADNVMFVHGATELPDYDEIFKYAKIVTR